MRKLLAAMVAVILCCSATFAQKAKSKSVFGFKGGFNASTFRTAVHYDNFDPDWKAGLVLGAFVEIPLAGNLTVQPEFLYSEMGSKGGSGEWGNVTFRYDYFSIPVLIKYRFCKSFNVFVGPQADFLIRARQRDFYRTVTITNDIKDFDFAVTAGLEAWFSKQFVLSARYIHGVRDVSFENETHTFFNQGVQVTFGYKLFKKAKKAKK
jgi:Outer membrane protein beta-barrel domain